MKIDEKFKKAIDALKAIDARLLYLDEGVEEDSPADEQISNAYSIAHDALKQIDDNEH